MPSSRQARSTSSRSASSQTRHPPLAGEMRFRSWLVVDAPLVSLALLCGVVAAGVISMRVSGSLPMGLCAAAVLLIASWRHWTPVQIVVDGRGVSQRALWRTRLIPWNDLAACRFDPRGVLLVRKGEPTWIAYCCGAYIPLAAARREVFLRLLRLNTRK